MVSLLPYKALDLHAAGSPEAVLQRLAAQIRPPRKPALSLAWGYFSDGAFHGKLKDNRFELIRDIRYHNSFLPLVKGIVLPDEHAGSVVHVEMKMRLRVTLFMLAAFTLIIFSLFTMPVFAEGGFFEILVPLLVSGAGVGLMALGFYPEAKKAQDFLEETLGMAKVVL